MKKNSAAVSLLLALCKACSSLLSFLLLLILLNIFYASKVAAQCTAVAGTLAGSGSFCNNDPINIGIPKTKKNQTYTWYLNDLKVVKGPVNGNGDAISYNAFAAPETSGHYTVVTKLAGCDSTEFGDVTVALSMPPSNLNITSVAIDSVAFKWNRVQDALGYEYVVDTSSADPFSGDFAFDTTASVNSLQPSTSYFIHVHQSSSFGGNCTWAKLKFKTAADMRPGILDYAFNGSGQVITETGSGAGASAIASQKGNKIVVAGFRNNGTNDDFLLVQYNNNGTVDNTFGNHGEVISDFGDEEIATSMSVLSNKKILVAGTIGNGDQANFILVRYNGDGTVDSSFGTNGNTITDFNSYGDYANSITVQSDGKIIVAGNADNASHNTNIAIVRYNSNGRPDKTFGTNGKVRTNINNGYDVAKSVAVQDDGKIVVGGFTGNLHTNVFKFCVIRYNINGSIDSSFGANGKTLIDFGSDANLAATLIIEPNRKILIGGQAANGTNSDYAIARLRSDGKIDKSFGDNGKTLIDFIGYDDQCESLQVDSIGRIIAGGDSFNGLNWDFSVTRLSNHGTIDSSFGTNGIVTTDFNSQTDLASLSASLLQSTGKIIIAGTTYGTSNSEIAMARYYAGDLAPLNKNVKTYNANNLAAKSPDQKIKLFPNPVRDILQIEGLRGSVVTRLSVFDITGKPMQVATTVNNNYSMEVKKLTAGVYFLRIDEGKASKYLKFIKQ